MTTGRLRDVDVTQFSPVTAICQMEMVASSSPSPSTSPVPVLDCPPGWSLYIDADGNEGRNSCIFAGKGAVGSYSAANEACALRGGRLLTVSAYTRTGEGLLGYSGQLAAAANPRASFAFIGCQQEQGSIARNRGWYWIDGGTPSDNLNDGILDCTGAPGCGIWATGAPKYVLS